MNLSTIRFIKDIRWEYPHKFRLRKVLEVGSQNINGSARKFFWFCKYTGVDISKGKGVDIVGRFCDLEFKNTFNVVLSTGTLEHDSTWIKTLQKMYELLDVGGLMIMTCAAPEHPEHGTKQSAPECSPDTTDYYRNISREDFKSVLPEHLFKEYTLYYERGMHDLMFHGIKK